ncbi:MAG: alanine--tRNA ligase [Planctomycetota bacterium]
MTSSQPNHDHRTSTQIRQQFIDFFVDKAGHTAVPSSPVVPHDDPTLLFANAGMNQFKPYFLGTEQPSFTRAVDTQKCIRAGGKHNDLDDVGKDTYHHTFFEMLGNWSFGDYFKKEAIRWAWELLVGVWQIDPERLHATYFEGDPNEGLEPDLEAKELWLQFLPESRVHPGNKKDNFWEMGDTGPCGPCSELHYDRSPDKDGAALVNADAQDTVVEIWNLVFIQYNSRWLPGGADKVRDFEKAPAPKDRNDPDPLEFKRRYRLEKYGTTKRDELVAKCRKLDSLPANHIDTGMGFERIVRVLQGVDSNYDTDVFQPIFTAIQKITGARAYVPGAGKEQLEDPINIAYRVIADHIRTLTFALSDGAHCTNEGRGYVLRSILRRAVRFGKQTLGVEEPFFYKLVQAVVDNFGDVFPEIKIKQADVEAELMEEEESFRKTLDRGIQLFEEAERKARDRWDMPMRDPGDPILPPSIKGKDAFKLHDTYGFPIGLTQLMAEERGLTVDLEGFEREMAAARERSRGESSGVDTKQSLLELVQLGLDSDWFEETEFVGHDQTEFPPKPNRFCLMKKAGEVYIPADAAAARDEVALVFQSTPFYAEAGGQVGDTGSVVILGGPQPVRVAIKDTIKIGGVHLHLGEVQGERLDAGIDQPVDIAMAVDRVRRNTIAANHTITHVMNRALRDHVSAHAMQKGSLVDDEKTRFDFSHNAALTTEQLEAVEKQVNDDIGRDLPVYAGYAPQEDALKINGLRAVFGEKYPPTVRIVSVGVKIEDLLTNPDNPEWQSYSVEFCGGTHLAQTGDAEGFVVLSQDAVSKGVRRITGLTGAAAHKATAEGEALLHRVEALGSASAQALEAGVEELSRALGEAAIPLLLKQKIQSGIIGLSERVKQFKKARGSQQAEAVVESARAVAEGASEDASYLVAQIPGADAKTLRTAMDVIRKKRPDAAMLLAADAGEGKVALLASVPKDLIAKGLKAGDWVKHTAPIVGGGGGGRPDMAQAGGKDSGKIEEALEAAKQFAEGKL